MNDKDLIAPHNNVNGSSDGGQNSNSYNNNNNEEAVQGSGELSYHIVNIVPTNRDSLDITTQLGIELNTLKYDTSNIVGSA